MYNVLYPFTDKEDGIVYEKGDTYPKGKRRVSKDRLAELMGAENALGKPLIEHLELGNRGRNEVGEA